MFEDATFSSRNLYPTQARKWMFATLTLNLAVVATLVVLPLMRPGTLPRALLTRTFLAPPAISQPAPVHHQASPHPATSQVLLLRDPYLAPTVSPTAINHDPDPGPPAPLNLTGNPIAGADGPPAVFPSDPPPAIRPAPKPQKTITLSGGVTEGLLLSKTTPTYPPLALATRTSGTVVLAATISTAGTIQHLRVLSGNPMLTTAALAAVQNWRYRPYQLNHQPVDVETTINVVFSLGNR